MPGRRGIVRGATPLRPLVAAKSRRAPRRHRRRPSRASVATQGGVGDHNHAAHESARRNKTLRYRDTQGSPGGSTTPCPRRDSLSAPRVGGAVGGVFVPLADLVRWKRVYPPHPSTARQLILRVSRGWHGQAKRRHVVAKTCRRSPAASLGMAPFTGKLCVGWRRRSTINDSVRLFGGD